MNITPTTPTTLDRLDRRLAEELEERTEFCDWLSVCTSVCGGNTSQPCSATTGVSGSGTCPATPTKCGH